MSVACRSASHGRARRVQGPHLSLIEMGQGQDCMRSHKHGATQAPANIQTHPQPELFGCNKLSREGPVTVNVSGVRRTPRLHPPRYLRLWVACVACSWCVAGLPSATYSVCSMYRNPRVYEHLMCRIVQTRVYGHNWPLVCVYLSPGCGESIFMQQEHTRVLHHLSSKQPATFMISFPCHPVVVKQSSASLCTCGRQSML